MQRIRPSSLSPSRELGCARFESAALGDFDIIFGRGCERFVGRFALLPDLRCGDGVIKFASFDPGAAPIARR